jgi:hypothetical protein
MLNNNNRYDLSDRLIHFFREVDLESASAPTWPEDTSHASISESTVLRPIFLLRHAIRLGRVYATWSIRNDRRTIHGHRPAVCFTEMPIAAFIEAGRARAAAGQAMSAYGLVFPKAAIFSEGARPVIYGLSTNATATGGQQGVPRLLPPSALPLDEQYRYVAFNPATGNLDWSHEREWRWPLTEDPWDDADGDPPTTSDELPGLELDNPALEGLGVIVETAGEAKQVIHDILTKVDRGDMSQRQYAFVIAHGTITDWNQLRDRGDLEQAIADNLIDLQPYFSQSRADVQKWEKKLASAVAAVLKKAPGGSVGEPGGSWLWILDSTHELTRALVNSGAARVNKEGKYLVRIPEFSGHYSLAQREELTRQLAGLLEKRHNLRADYFSVLGSDDPNEVPFYNGDQLDDRLFYNWN